MKYFFTFFLLSAGLLHARSFPVHGTGSFPSEIRELSAGYFAGMRVDWKIKLVGRIRKKFGENNRTVAAVLAFPVFGIVGLHRIYLGTKPYVPVVYAATLGGCAGLLPLVDFFAILCAKKESFENFKENPRVFMWAK